MVLFLLFASIEMEAQAKKTDRIVTASSDSLVEVYLYDSLGNEYHTGKLITIHPGKDSIVSKKVLGNKTNKRRVVMLIPG